MFIISIDYGVKYLGIGILDFKIFKIYPLIIFKTSDLFIKLFKNFLILFNVKLILIGYPIFIKSNSKIYVQLIFLIKKLIVKLNNLYFLKIKLINEFCSSFNFNIKSDHLVAYNFIKNYLKI